MSDLSQYSTAELEKEIFKRTEDARLQVRVSLFDKSGYKWLEANPHAIVGSTSELDSVVLKVKDGQIILVRPEVELTSMFKKT